MKELSKTLSPEEKSELAACEQIIETGKSTFVSVGLALAKIKKLELYRENFEDFDTYCQKVWDFGQAYGYRLISAAEVAKKVSPIGEITNEATARELASVPKKKQIKVAKEAKKIASKIGGKITAKNVKQAAEKLGIKKEARGGLAAEMRRMKENESKSVEKPKAIKGDIHPADRVELWWGENRLKLLEHPAISCDALIKQVCTMLRKG